MPHSQGLSNNPYPELRINPIPCIDTYFFKIHSNILHVRLGHLKDLFPVGVPVKSLIKNVLKRRKECGTYLATACRHRWSVKMTMKNDK